MPMAFNPVTLELQPCENGVVLYQRVAPLADGLPGRAMVYFQLRAHNHTAATITARRIEISFPGGVPAPMELTSRNIPISAGGSAEIGLSGTEAFAMDLPTPPTLRITVNFDGLAQAVVGEWGLQGHSRNWAFFAKPEPDPKYGEYVTLPGRHMDGGGPQHFGYDVGVLGVNSFGQLSETKNGLSSNEDRFLWGRPIYAMADGVVVRAVDEHIDNPSPSQRAFARKAGSYEGTVQISSVAVANLSRPADDRTDLNRFFVAVHADENVRVVVLQQNADGSEVEYLSGTGGPSTDGGLSVAGISETRAVTCHETGADVRLGVWTIASNGSSVSLADTQQVPLMSGAKVVKLTSNRVAVLGRTAGGTLSLTVHQFSDAGEFLTGSIGSATGGIIKKFDVVALSSSRIAAAVQTLNDGLKLIVWDVGIGGYSTGNTPAVSLNRVGEAEGHGSITELALAAKNSEQIATAVRTSAGTLKLIVWDVVASGAIERRGDVTAEEGSQVDLSFFKTKAYALGYRTASGKLRLAAWEANQDDNTKAVTFKLLFTRETDGTTNAYAMALIPTEQPTIVTALRTQTGVLKVILWQFTDSNLIYILHGNDMIHFVHLQQGSIPDHLLQPGTPVSAGQFVGRMGHSGKSSSPHLHIHATAVRPDLAGDVEKIIEELAIGNEVGYLRPLHFHGVRGMAVNQLVPGWDNNPMALFDGEGTYFQSYAIWPAPGHAQQAAVPVKLAS